MRKFFLETALLPDGWAHDVLVGCDRHGRIASVQHGHACPPDAERLAGVALPGMPNLHSHAHQRAIAGLAETSGDGTDSFWTWREAMYRAVSRFDPDTFQAVATQLYVEMLKAGYTRVAEFHYLHHAADGRPYADPAEMSLRVIAAAHEAGIGLTLLPVLYAASGFDGAHPAAAQHRFAHDLDGFLKLIGALRAHAKGIVLGIAPHSLRAVPAVQLTALVQAVPDGPIHIHIAEQQREVEECRAHRRQRPVEWLLAHVPVDARWCLIHATHVTEEELGGIASAGAIVGLCPTTEANLGDGIFPAEAFIETLGRVGIGSDSHISVSPVEELRWLEYAQRLTSNRRAVLAGGRHRATGRHLFDAAVTGGAAACGIHAGIARGRPADMIVLDNAHPLLAARAGDAVLDSWIFSGNVPLVRHVVAGGHVVIRDGHHPEESRIAGRFTAALEQLAA